MKVGKTVSDVAPRETNYLKITRTERNDKKKTKKIGRELGNEYMQYMN